MANAQTLAADGHTALDAGRFEEAAHLFDQSIAAIGTTYQKPGVIDDTGMKLTLSEAEARKANWPVAANLKAKVAEARLAFLSDK